MVEFCADNYLLIGNIFPNKRIHQITFATEERNVKSRTEVFVYTGEIRWIVFDIRVYQSAELSTQHRLPIMKISFRKERK